MNTSDARFISRFSGIVAGIVLIAIALVFLARGIAAATPQADEPRADELQPAVAMAPGSAAVTASVGAPGDSTVGSAGASEGETVYQQVCSVCHGPGIAGAPRNGDNAAWGPRIAQGKPTLYDHALHGFTGKTGVMAPKAGRSDLSDASVQAAVDYMLMRSGTSKSGN